MCNYPIHAFDGKFKLLKKLLKTIIFGILNRRLFSSIEESHVISLLYKNLKNLFSRMNLVSWNWRMETFGKKRKKLSISCGFSPYRINFCHELIANCYLRSLFGQMYPEFSYKEYSYKIKKRIIFFQFL